MKHWKAIVGAVVIAAVMNVSFADAQRIGVPRGWVASGAIGDGYEVGLDPAEGTGGRSALFIRKTGWAASGATSSANEGTSTGAKIAAVSQTIDATPWRGKQVTFSLWARTAGDSALGEFWARASYTGSVLTSSSSYGAIIGWKEIKARVNIPANSEKLDFGVLLTGGGQVWVRDLKLEFDSSDSPLGRQETLTKSVPIGAPTPAPVNLDLLE